MPMTVAAASASSTLLVRPEHDHGEAHDHEATDDQPALLQARPDEAHGQPADQVAHADGSLDRGVVLRIGNDRAVERVARRKRP